MFNNRHLAPFFTAIFFTFALGFVLAAAQTSSSQTPQTANQASPNQTKDNAPEITGAWAGTWGAYSPSQGTTPPKSICKELTAKIERKDDLWQAPL